jgi:transposase
MACCGPASSRPLRPKPIRQLRELMRSRKALVQERTQEANRLQKVVESANLQLAGVASDVLGVRGRLMLRAGGAGEDDPVALAERARGQRRRKLAPLAQALEGRVQAHHRVLIRASLRHGHFLEPAIAAVAAVAAQVEQRVTDFAQQLALLQSIPGVQRTAAVTILAEIGPDMEPFASAKHLASWAGVDPGNRQRGGKRLSGQTAGGPPWLRGRFGEVAWAAVRRKDPSVGARFRRLSRRQNKQKALRAVRPNLVLVSYPVLRDQVPDHELGPDYFQPQDPQRQVRGHVRRLEQLGDTVTLLPSAVA